MSDRSEDMISRLRAMKPAFKGMGLRRVRVFGSVARGDAGPGSDIDLLVDFVRSPSLFDMGGVLMDFQDGLGCKVDLVTPETIHPALKDNILSEAVDV